MADAVTTEKGTGFNFPAVVILAIAVLVFVYALSLFLQGGYNKVHDLEFQAKVFDAESMATGPLAEQQAILDKGYRWVDRANGKVGMSIDDAKKLVVSRDR